MGYVRGRAWGDGSGISVGVPPASNRGAGWLMPFATIEWKIIITPDKDEKELVKISVNRGLTGL
jgi:hypothetical protein